MAKIRNELHGVLWPFKFEVLIFDDYFKGFVFSLRLNRSIQNLFQAFAALELLIYVPSDEIILNTRSDE